MSARQRANQPGNKLQESTSPAYGSHRIYANCKINGSPVRFMVDTGADVTILSTASANLIKLSTSNPSGSLQLLGVTGNSSAPLINVNLQIETQPAFTTQIAVAQSNWNLLAIKDLSRVYSIKIDASGGHLTPIARSPAQIAAVNTIPPVEQVAPIPTFNLSPKQLETAVMVATVLLVLSALS